MRIWVEFYHSGTTQVNFQPDSAEESEQLDKLLGFTYQGRQLSGLRDQTVSQGARPVAELGGLETQRWIITLP